MMVRFFAGFVLSLAFIQFWRAAEAEHSETPSEPLEEIIVRGSSPGTLRGEMYRAEERFYEVFNSLNSDDEYDIHCEMRDNGAHIMERICEPRFVGNLTGHAAEWMMKDRGGYPVYGMLIRKKELLREEITRLVIEHPELRNALGELSDATRAWKDRGTAQTGLAGP